MQISKKSTSYEERQRMDPSHDRRGRQLKVSFVYLFILEPTRNCLKAFNCSQTGCIYGCLFHLLSYKPEILS